jgi:hypothetical protein
MTNLINLTPHPINIGSLTIPPSGTVARAAEDSVSTGTINVDGTAVPIVRIGYGPVTGLPSAEEDTLLIVSSIVVSACPDRRDLVVPTGFVRDEAGRIVGATALGCGVTPSASRKQIRDAYAEGWSDGYSADGNSACHLWSEDIDRYVASVTPVDPWREGFAHGYTAALVEYQVDVM